MPTGYNRPNIVGGTGSRPARVTVRKPNPPTVGSPLQAREVNAGVYQPIPAPGSAYAVQSTPVAATPTTVPDLGGGADADSLEGPLGEFQRLNAEALESALKAIEAQFGLTKEQLLADQSALGQEYQLLNAQLEQQRERGLEQTVQGFQERGITRSGLAAEGVALTEQAFADEGARLAREQSSAEEAIAGELARLQQEQELAELEARRQSEQALLDLEILQLLNAAGL